jgi:hypothetical protein
LTEGFLSFRSTAATPVKIELPMPISAENRGVGALVRPPAPLLVVPSLEEIDCFIGDAVDQPVFLSDTPRPTAGEHILQRFGLSRAFERIRHDCLNEFEDSDGGAALVFDPKPEVLKKLGLKYGDPLRVSLHQASLFAERLLTQA